MGNAAYMQEYKQRRNQCLPLFVSNNFTQNIEHRLSDEYSVHVKEYGGKVNGWNLRGSECTLTSRSKKTIAEWRSIDSSGDFYRMVKHGNGKEYLIFRQDLYGYSVLDVHTGEAMQFFPQSSLDGGETFIWMDIEYNAAANVLAVSGCYWACPYGVQLFTFDDPMSDAQKYIDLIERFNNGHYIYSDVDFAGWDNGSLRVTRRIIAPDSTEEIRIAQSEYLTWLSEKGQSL